ncbi:MAG: hypothetical protein GX283_04500 [Clostridiaceae bacterium]|nr:hypothetical protein [Clostridiaceae bacterium]
MLKYTELKDFLGKYPDCFKPNVEKQREFDQKVSSIEGKTIDFIQPRKRK